VKVLMADLKAQYQSIRDEIDGAVAGVMQGGRFVLGDNVKTLEQQVAEFCGADFGIGVASGTDALILALSAVGIREGDEVITVPFTFVSTVEAISLLGARAVFVDVDPRTLNIDAADVESKITRKTRAILPVHLYGQVVDVDTISKIAHRYELRAVWDGAQAIGAEYNGQPIGCFGDAVALSFFPTKNLGAAGDGGMILTNDSDLAEKLRFIRFHGSGGTYSYRYVGYCSRLDELQAAILRAKLPHLKRWTDIRRRNAGTYNKLLADLDIVLPMEAPGNKHVYHQYTVRTKRRDELRVCLKSREIDTGVYYPGPLHFEEAYKYLGYSEGDFPEAEKACHEVLSLPIHPELTDEQMAHVGSSVRSFLEQCRPATLIGE